MDLLLNHPAVSPSPKVRIPAAIYIDDLIFAVSRGLTDKAMSIVMGFFEKVGLPIQAEKTEVMTPLVTDYLPNEMFRVLGLNFQLFERSGKHPAFLEVTLPAGRKKAILDMVEVMASQVRGGCLTLKMAQQTTGSIISAIFHNRHRVHVSRLRILFIISDERRFKDVIRKKAFRELLLTTLNEVGRILEETPPFRIAAEEDAKNLAPGYTDASLEKVTDDQKQAAESPNVAMLAGLFMLGTKGGSISLRIRFAFPLKDAKPKYGIAVYEALAVLVAIRRFPPRMFGQFRVAIGIDSANVLYCLVGGVRTRLGLDQTSSLPSD